MRSRLGRGQSAAPIGNTYGDGMRDGGWVSQVPKLADVCLVSCVGGIACCTVGWRLSALLNRGHNIDDRTSCRERKLSALSSSFSVKADSC